MNTPLWSPRLGSKTFDQWPSNTGLNIAAIYEGFAAGIRASEALEWLVRDLAPLRIVSKAWSFGMLTRLDVRAAAIREAADADLLIVAASGDQRLPVQVVRWLERCMLESRNGPAALVVLHDDGLPESSALATELKRIASRWQIDFIGNNQFEDWLNGDYVREVLRRTESSIDTVNRPPPLPSRPITGLAVQQRKSLAVVKMGA